MIFRNVRMSIRVHSWLDSAPTIQLLHMVRHWTTVWNQHDSVFLCAVGHSKVRGSHDKFCILLNVHFFVSSVFSLLQVLWVSHQPCLKSTGAVWTIPSSLRWGFWYRFLVPFFCPTTEVYRLKDSIQIPAGWWFQTFFIFTPKIGEDEPIWTSIFFKWVVQPPTSQISSI